MPISDVKNDGLKLTSIFYKAANGRQSYELYQATSALIPVVAEILRQRFGFSECKPPFVGLDEALTECEKGDSKLLLGWDNWSGFYIMADSEVDDLMMFEIGSYLDSIIQQPEFESYIDHW